jgi:lon-related putative ATP-dependent protease
MIASAARRREVATTLKKSKKKFREVPVSRLRWTCGTGPFKFRSTKELKACEHIIGQEKAVKALRLGLDIEGVGYNVFVTGKVGTGRTTSVKCLLEDVGRKENIPGDKCYVNNFVDPDRPRLITLPAGKGKKLRKDMEELVDELSKGIPLIFDSESYRDRRMRLVDKYREIEKKLVSGFEEKVKKEGFILVQVQVGPFSKPDIAPVINEKPVMMDQLKELLDKGEVPKAEVERIVARREELNEELGEIFRETRNIEKKAREELLALDTSAASPLIRQYIEELRKKYDIKDVHEYLDEVEKSIFENLDAFKGKGEEKPPGTPDPPFPQKDPFLDYRVNVLVDNSATKGAPIVFETTPSYKNLFGTIEKAWFGAGQWAADFTRIKAGSILAADGGYLVLNALDTLLQPGVWQALKRTLRNRTVEIESFDPFYMFTVSALKPEPIKVDLKVVMIGDPFVYYLLYERDDDFKKIFKVRADFDWEMPLSRRAVSQYASLVAKVCADENLMAFDRTGVAAVVEYGARVAGRQNKLTTLFNEVSDILREANYWAKKDDSKSVTSEHVSKAIRERIDRVDLIEEKIQEMIEDGSIMMDTRGSVAGQVNGLSVYSTGEYSFGKPSRITAKTSVGRAGVINIEREAELSGPTHNKGVLILSGYLRGKYAQDKPLTMSASLCFEQSYGGVDGDSASSTEVYALLSALSGIPLRQDLAVTGSVNQKGEIQAIGGVNQKIEGFFEVCKAEKLTGTQGVVIPVQNTKDLMLRKEVVESVKAGKFHIYPVSTIDEGIELLTGVVAGRKRKDNTYPEGSVNFLVNRKLEEYARTWREFRASEGGGTD